MKKKIITETEIGYIPTILEVAGLIHDIGNPPFGHFGEEIIKSYFQKIKSFSDDNLIKNAFDSLTDEQQADFLNFDGNVQGFRILRKLGLAHDNFLIILQCPFLLQL